MFAPQLSIVIASCIGPPFITRCLESLGSQRGGVDVEFLVVDRAGGRVAALIERDFPWVTLVRRPPGESVPDLRRHGIEAARSSHVAIIEEHCVARGDWIATLLSCMRDPVAATGGVVADAAYPRLVDWAVYFTEYNGYLPPGNRGETRDVCAANCLYRREVLLRHLATAGSGYWEAGLHQTLLAAGERFRTEPELVVYHTGPFRFGYYLRQRFLFSRGFAGIRRQRVSTGFRLAYLLLAPCLVPLLWGRMALRVVARRRRIGRFLLAQPYLVPVIAIYVLGEWMGFLAGPGGSLSRIE
jgi:Glycosyl transferase family 2